MRYKSDVCLDILGVLAYGPQPVINSAGQILLHYYPLKDVGELKVLITAIGRFSIAFTGNVRLKFPVYQKLVKFIWFQLLFCLLATAMEQVLKTEK